MRRIGLQIGRLDRQRRRCRAAAAPRTTAKAHSRISAGLVVRPVRGDRVAEMEQRLRRQQDAAAPESARPTSQVGTRRRCCFSCHSRNATTYATCGSVGASACSAASRRARRRFAVVVVAASAPAASACELRRVTVGGPSSRFRRARGSSRSRLRRERDQRGDAVEYRAAMAAAHLPVAHRELLRGDPENRLAPRTASEFLVSHGYASGVPPTTPIRPRSPIRR